jgi:hypothetical protein
VLPDRLRRFTAAAQRLRLALQADCQQHIHQPPAQAARTAFACADSEKDFYDPYFP